MVSIFVAVSKSSVVLHAQGGARVLAVSIEVGQTRAGHQVAQVAVVCCEVVISRACGVRMAKDFTRAVFPLCEPEEEIVFIPEYWGDMGSHDDVVLNPTSHIQALLPTGTLGALLSGALQENRLERWTLLGVQRISLIATSRARLLLVPQINLRDNLGGDLAASHREGVGHVAQGSRVVLAPNHHWEEQENEHIVCKGVTGGGELCSQEN